ncbi:Na+/H+ antiporter NhaA [Deinococcus aetherius]|nr:Na+/H+ antiporter NhaA [Deinococcus aetherius]
MVGADLLAGIGFTMSLLVSTLAFADAALLTQRNGGF